MSRTISRYQPIEVINGMVVCKKCGETKSENDFYRTTRGRVQGECKECAKTRISLHRMLNYDSVLASCRDRPKSQKHRANRQAWQRISRIENKNKHSAREQVAYALRTGDLIKLPCAFCGSVKSQAHHDDYSKPLDAMWLCQPHHAARHAFLRYFGYE